MECSLFGRTEKSTGRGSIKDCSRFVAVAGGCLHPAKRFLIMMNSVKVQKRSECAQ